MLAALVAADYVLRRGSDKFTVIGAHGGGQFLLQRLPRLFPRLQVAADQLPKYSLAFS
jgi:hypothetical protein